jgi:hypothetical protein
MASTTHVPTPYCVVFPEPVSPTMTRIWCLLNFLGGEAHQLCLDELGREERPQACSGAV